MPNFVVERYRSSSDPDSLRAVADRLIAGARQASLDGASVRHIDTIFLPGDETCLHVFQADSEADVLAVTRQAGIEREARRCGLLANPDCLRRAERQR